MKGDRVVYNRGYDIPAPDFKTDLNFGEAGEDVVRGFIADVLSGSYEIKTDRYRNGRMVIETQQKPNSTNTWVDSGINVTTAKWWVYQYNLDGAFHIVAVDRLKRYLRLNNKKFNESTKINCGNPHDNPARGFLLYQGDVTDLLVNSAYDAE